MGGGAVSKKYFFRHSGPQFGLKIGGGGRTPRAPPLGSATASPQINFLDILTFFPSIHCSKRGGAKMKN